MSKSGKTINYVSEFKDASGHRHWTVSSYDRLSGIATMLKDNIFEDVKKTSADLLDGSYPLKEDLDDMYIEDGKRFQVETCLTASTFEYVIRDTILDDVIAGFDDMYDAYEYCEKKNLDFKYNEKN